MTNDNNTPKSASHMLFHELAANGGTKRDTRDIVDRLNTFTANNRDWPTIADAAAEIIQLRAKVHELEAARDAAQMEEKQYCDNCGAVVRGDETDTFVYGELPCDIASANKGESAVVCNACFDMIEANANNEYFKKNHR